MPHPDAMVALLSGSGAITAHFASPPFLYHEKAKPGLHSVLSNYELLGGKATFNVVWSTSKFHDANPKAYGAFVAAFEEATNFINTRVRGHTLPEVKVEIERTLKESEAQLDALTQKIVAEGLASWSGGENEERKLIVRGQAHLLEDLKALADLERVRLLFDDLETRREVIDLLGRAEGAEGVRVFIGSENKLFSLSGSSTIVAPYHNASGQIVGVLGVIGPTRLNYARIVPMVDYTAKIVSKLLGG